MLVTHAMLVAMDACAEQADLFLRLYPEGLEATPENAQDAYRRGLDVSWFLRAMPAVLPGPLMLKRDPDPARPVVIVQWRQNGLLHRDEGPAVIWSDGIKQWWRRGECVFQTEPPCAR